MKEPYMLELRKGMKGRPVLLPGVRAIIPNRRGEILFQLRNDPECWGLPGGSVEIGESAFEAVAREVAEETSLEVVEAEPMALYSGGEHRFKYREGGHIYCFSMAFIIRTWKGTPKPDGIEGTETRFFPLDNLPSRIFHIHKPTIEDYQRYDGTFILG